jgi:hypothetical protein
MGSTCWRCGNPAEEQSSGTQPVCDRCRGVTRSVVDARNAPEAQLRHRFPVVQEHQLEGLPLGVLEVEDWTPCFVLRYAIFPRADSFEAVSVEDFEQMHLGLWQANDDQGTEHYGIGATAEAVDARYTGDVWLASALPTGTKALSISFRAPPSGDMDLLTVEVPLRRSGT